MILFNSLSKIQIAEHIVIVKLLVHQLMDFLSICLQLLLKTM